MEDQTQEITREDVLILTLHQDLASWVGVEPMEYQKWLNQLLPWQEGEVIIAALRPVDIEIQCIITAITLNLDKTHKEYDNFAGNMLTGLIIAMRTGSYAYAARIREMATNATLFLAIKRRKNQAWWTEVEPDPQTKLVETLKGLL